MPGHAEAFVKGGCGCLATFAVLAALMVMLGGHAHIDLGGACCLFVTGGLLGLLVLWIYNRGRRDATDRVGDTPNPDFSKLDDRAIPPRACPYCNTILTTLTADDACPHCGQRLL